MRRIKISRGGRPYKPMSRQHKRTLAWLLFSTFAFGAYYIWSAGPIDPFAVPFESHETYMSTGGRWGRLNSRQSYDWRKAPFINRIESIIPLPSGEAKPLPRVQAESFPESSAQRRRREAQRVAVRDEFRRSWESYRKYAWGLDELNPVQGRGLDTFGGWGATLVDSLDTLWIMGFKEYFYEAVEAVAAIDFGKSTMKTVSVFETTIRYLGGLLSAYDLSQEPVLLEKAIQLAEMLYRAFDTTNNTPLNFLDIEDAKNTYRSEWPAETAMCFACIGSLTMEFTRLAQITKEAKYYDVVARITTMLDESQNSTKIPGLWPTNINAAKGEFNQSRFFSIGALADSTYEYFPKIHALLGGLDPVYEKLYKDAALVIDKHMLFRPHIPNEEVGKDLLFCGDIRSPRPGDVSMDPDLQHLTCFIGGMFGLAGRLFSNQTHVDLGAKLTKGCVYAYAAMPSGIMPEAFTMMPCKSRTKCPWNAAAWEREKMRTCGSRYIAASEPDSPMRTSTSSTSPTTEDAEKDTCNLIPGFPTITDPRYLLRPEAIESVFILYRITADPIYLNYAWTMFRAITLASRTPYANGQVRDVTFVPGTSQLEGAATREDNVEDKMESFWTAETLKYFYLVFSKEDMISLDDWVFNTEAHPFRRPKRA